MLAGKTDAPVRAADHLSAVILLQDRELAHAFADTRLTQTLAAWLDHQRQTPQIAEALHVHPQTVRYRIAKLRELLGDALDDPDGRFDLQLALRISSGRYRRTGDT
jgi:DNA-binding PucR family transcriptional regulator